jgi:hypothetical protein
MKSFLLLLLSVQAILGQALPSANHAVAPTISGAAATSTLNTGLIAYWKLDETSSTRIDSEPTGTPQDLSDNNTVGSAAGKISNAAAFVAAGNDFLSRTDSADLSTGDIDWTIVIWFYLSSKGGDRDLIAKWGGAPNNEYLFRFQNSSDRMQLLISSNGTATGVTLTCNNFGSPALTTWTQAVVWHNASANTVNVRFNDTTLDTASYSGGSIDGAGAFGIASRVPTSGTYWDGRADETAFYKRTLTGAEMTEIYALGSGKTCCAFAP